MLNSYLGMRSEDITGQVFGKLVALEETRKNDRGAWICQCSCGRKHVAQTSELKRGKVQSCGCFRFEAKVADLAGQTFGRLKAVVKVRHRGWECLCECGTTCVIASDKLKSGHTRSCGCLIGDVLTTRNVSGNVGRKFEDRTLAAKNKLLTRYRKGAESRAFAWNLSDSECEIMFKAPCHYCGRVEVKAELARTHGANPTSLLPYTYNGIDRKDNTRGYEPDNCVACCKDCNFAKSNRTYDEFVTWLKTISLFWSHR